MSEQPAKTDSDHKRGLEASRLVAGWQLGDPGWADSLIAAYNDPAATWVQDVRKEKEKAADKRLRRS